MMPHREDAFRNGKIFPAIPKKPDGPPNLSGGFSVYRKNTRGTPRQINTVRVWFGAGREMTRPGVTFLVPTG